MSFSNSKAISKIQSIVLTVIIIIAGSASVITYYFWSQTTISSETIKIGVLSDLDGLGRFVWQPVVLAAEQINEEGGILGRQVEVIGEDTDTGSGFDATTIMSALTRLLTIHEVDFIVGDSFQVGIDTISQHKKICISQVVNNFEELVLEDYDKHKYFFSVCPNTTAIAQGTVTALQTLSENTDFTKVAYLFGHGEQPTEIMNILDAKLPALYGYEIVYRGSYPPNVIDFSSYFAQAEAAGAEILIPWVPGFEGTPFVKEYYDRQSPMIIYSGLLGGASVPDAWGRTGGKCEYVCVSSNSFAAGYPLTSKTLPAREAYIERWERAPGIVDTFAYNTIRFILPDAIERAGTLETDAVIEALEQINVETTSSKNFAFSSSHGLMYEIDLNDKDAIGEAIIVFQWDNGTMVPIHPSWIRDEAGTTLKFPPWPGPWD